MERKIVKQGRNALTITLPSNWTKKFNLTDKDSINIFEEKNYLKIYSNKPNSKKEIELDITNMEKGLMFNLVLGKYIEGYDIINIKHNNYELTQILGNSFIGFVIEQHTQDKLILKNIISVPEENFIQIFNRSCQMLISQARLLNKIIIKEISLETLKNEERLLDKNLFYCQRYINKYEKIENSYKYFLLTATIESIGDLISKIGNSIENQKKISKEDKKIIDLIIYNIENYVVFLFQNNITEMYKLLQNFKNQINSNSFIHGVAYAIREQLYNYIGFLIKNKN